MMLQRLRVPRPGLWLPGVTIMFAVFASQETIPIDTLSPSELGSYKLPSSVGSFIVEAMCFVISGLCVSAAWDAARMHEVAKNLGRREQLVKVFSWILLPCFFLGGLCIYHTLGVSAYPVSVIRIPTPIHHLTERNGRDNLVGDGYCFCLAASPYCRAASGSHIAFHYYHVRLDFG